MLSVSVHSEDLMAAAVPMAVAVGAGGGDVTAAESRRQLFMASMVPGGQMAAGRLRVGSTRHAPLRCSHP